MKVNIIRVFAEVDELEITGATLLTVGEAEKLPKGLRIYPRWWWYRCTTNVRDGQAII